MASTIRLNPAQTKLLKKRRYIHIAVGLMSAVAALGLTVLTNRK